MVGWKGRVEFEAHKSAIESKFWRCPKESFVDRGWGFGVDLNLVSGRWIWYCWANKRVSRRRGLLPQNCWYRRQRTVAQGI